MCRRTCPSGGWRAGPIWRRWVMHLSWTTSREQHLLATTPAARCVSHTGITWPGQELQDQSAGSGNLTGSLCFKSIQEKRLCLFLAFHLRRLCFLWFALNRSTALKRFIVKTRAQSYVGLSILTCTTLSSMRFVYFVCITCSVHLRVHLWDTVSHDAMRLTLHFCPSSGFIV